MIEDIIEPFLNELKEGDIFHLGDEKIQYTVTMHDGELTGKCIGCYGSYVGLKYWADRIRIVKRVEDGGVDEHTNN